MWKVVKLQYLITLPNPRVNLKRKKRKVRIQNLARRKVRVNPAVRVSQVRKAKVVKEARRVKAVKRPKQVRRKKSKKDKKGKKSKGSSKGDKKGKKGKKGKKVKSTEKDEEKSKSSKGSKKKMKLQVLPQPAWWEGMEQKMQTYIFFTGRTDDRGVVLHQLSAQVEEQVGVFLTRLPPRRKTCIIRVRLLPTMYGIGSILNNDPYFRVYDIPLLIRWRGPQRLSRTECLNERLLRLFFENDDHDPAKFKADTDSFLGSLLAIMEERKVHLEEKSQKRGKSRGSKKGKSRSKSKGSKKSKKSKSKDSKKSKKSKGSKKSKKKKK
uniref:Thioredoxin domain-containing protein n=1 Tax=Lygus hesperus TaxID=30085 RepID=A0A0K8SGX2_LYGHE